MKSDRPVRPEDKGGVLGTFGLTEEQGNEIIMAARAHWFEDEEDVAPAAASTETAARDPHPRRPPMRTPPNERLTSGIADAQTGAGKSAPERKCILSGEHDARASLVRLAISPDGDVLPDVQAKAPGRGAWLGVTRPELEAAIAKGKLKGALARAFKGAALTIPDDLPQRIEDALRRYFSTGWVSKCVAETLSWGLTELQRQHGAAALACCFTPPMQAREGPPSSIRHGASAATRKVPASAERACHWTVRLCLWHWAARTSSIWASAAAVPVVRATQGAAQRSG